VGGRLRDLWDFRDLDATEQRFLGLLDEGAAGKAEILTQLARVEGLRGRFEGGERLLQEAETLAGASPSATAHIKLERGRLRRSSGDEEGALPLFESAYEIAVEAGDEFVAADAAHMAALVAPDRAGMHSWTQRGIEVAEASDEPEVRYWLGPLLNNLGWDFYEAGEYARALDAFQRALEARERFPEQRAEIEIARYAVGKSLRALGRPAEAAALLEQAVSWAESEGSPDGWFHEELAEDYAALGRDSDARAQAAQALALVEADDVFRSDTERVSRLRRLAASA
jgi:tetratricopeptide (TPR) repeat protein